MMFFVVVSQLGDVIDARDEEMGAWFEARIVKISTVSASVECDSREELQQSSSSVEVNNAGDEATVCSNGADDEGTVCNDGAGDAGTVCNDGAGDEGTVCNDGAGDEGTVCNDGTSAPIMLKTSEAADDGFLYSIVFERSV